MIEFKLNASYVLAIYYMIYWAVLIFIGFMMHLHERGVFNRFFDGKFNEDVVEGFVGILI